MRMINSLFRCWSVVSLTLLVIGMVSCGPSKNVPVKNEMLKKVDTAAVLSLYCSENIKVLGANQDSNEIIRKKVVDLEGVHFSRIASDLKRTVFEEYSSVFPFELLPESRVAQHSSYSRMNRFGVNSRGFALPNGYVVVPPSSLDDNDIESISGMFPAADAFLISYINFAVKNAGNDRVNAKAFMTLKLIDLERNEVINVQRSVVADQTIGLDSGEMVRRRDVKRVCRLAAQKAMDEMQKFLGKAIAE